MTDEPQTYEQAMAAADDLVDAFYEKLWQARSITSPRLDALRNGAKPTDGEIDSALILDTDPDTKFDLTTEQLAVAKVVSELLRDEPNYRAAVEAANNADRHRSEVDALSERVLAGGTVPSSAEVDAAYTAIETRRVGACALAATVAKRYVVMRFKPARGADRARSRPRRVEVRPRARRTHAQARSSSRGGDSGDDDGPGDPEPPAEAADAPLARLWRALTRLGLAPRSVRWCRSCHRFAFAVDDYQRARLDEIGFHDLCPRCARKEER